MRRVICLMAALLVCVAVAMPAFAATGTFVPSISYKDGPEVEKAELNGEDTTGCLVVTSLKEAKEKTTDIYQEERDLLLEVYEKLNDDTMKLPLKNANYVVRELVDVSFAKTGCVEVSHGHKEWLAQENTTVEIVFDLGIKKGTDLEVLVYLNGEWIPVNDAVNNGDGTVTCVFEDICPVAFCVEPQVSADPPKTGDIVGGNTIYWMILLASSFCAVVVLIINRRKFIY